MIGVMFNRDLPVPPRPEPKVPRHPDLDALASFPSAARKRLRELRREKVEFTPAEENRLIALSLRVSFTDAEVEPYGVAPLGRG